LALIEEALSPLLATALNNNLEVAKDEASSLDSLQECWLKEQSLFIKDDNSKEEDNS
jgi:hypothetical protein